MKANPVKTQENIGIKHKRTRSRMRFSRLVYGVMTLTATVIILFCTVSALRIRIELAELNDKNVSLQMQLQEAESEKRRLCLKYESEISLPELYEKAVESFGMTRPELRQIRSIDTGESEG